MFHFRKPVLVLMMAAGMVAAQPALTTIQDILYRANGTRFNGTMFIAWSAFQAGDGSNVATANLTLPIVNGVLNVQLVPTTTASAGAQYNVTFNSQGVNQFTQVWAVPPSTVSLRVSAVLVSQGTVVGPAPLTGSPIEISDVVGLENELALLPQEGVGFVVGRTAVINSSGQIDGAGGKFERLRARGRKLGSMRIGGRGSAAVVFRRRDAGWVYQRIEHCFHAGVHTVAGGQPGSVSERSADETGGRLHAEREHDHIPDGFDAADRRHPDGQLPICESVQSAGDADVAAGDLQQRRRQHQRDDDHPVGQLHHSGRAIGHRRPDRDPVSIRAHRNGDCRLRDRSTGVVRRSFRGPRSRRKRRWQGERRSESASGAQAWNGESWGNTA